jgi:hypothetical protein
MGKISRARKLEQDNRDRTAGEDGQDSAAKAEKRGQDGRGEHHRTARTGKPG